MVTSIHSHKDEGPCQCDIHGHTPIGSYSQFISHVRACFENQDDAILVKRDDKVVGLWLREPDIDWDCDGYYEIGPGYSGAEYCLYRPDYKGFWNYVGFHFGHKFVPEEYSFETQRHPKFAVWE